VDVPKLGNYDARALPQLAWQVSAVPAQLLGLHGAERRGLPFLAAVTGTAALGVVDWPVALLIAGGYLLTSRPPGQSPAAGPPPAPAPRDAATSGRTPAAPPLADPKPTAQPAPARLSAAEPEPSSPTADAGPPTATPAASPPRQPGQPAPTPVSVDQPSPQAATSAAAAQPNQPPAPAIARQQRQSRPSRDTRRSPSPSAATREPWPGYDQMTVPRVLARLDDPDVDLAAVERYEKAHRDRKMVHAAIAGRRASRQS
jgi:hypothetical protein